jgi:hypothetical protein
MSAATRTIDLAPQPLAARELFRRVYCTSDGDPEYWQGLTYTHSFPFPLNLSLLCPSPLNAS